MIPEQPCEVNRPEPATGKCALVRNRIRRMIAVMRWHECRNLIVIVLLAGSSCRGQDQAIDVVIVRRAQSSREVTYKGRVLDYAAGILRFRMKTGSVRQFKTGDIRSIATPQTEPHRNGLQQLKEKKLLDAIASLEVASRDEPRDWVRRDILATLTRANLKHGTRLAAAEAFVKLTNSDPNTHHSGAIPLWWSNRPATAASQRQAREWLTSPNYSARLIAASILMCDPDSRKEANDALDAIAVSGRAHVIDLARIQQWRARLADPRRISDTQLKSWRRRLRSMKASERAGGWFLLGEVYSQRLDHDRAAIAFLWLPTVYSDDLYLTAEASFKAAQSLQQAGRFAEAEATYRDTAMRFANTPFGEQADKMLKPAKTKPSQKQ